MTATSSTDVKQTAQERLRDFSPDVLNDRHDRQYALLEATGVLGDPPYRVLDLGAGSGVTAVWAARRGWPVTAVDVKEKHLAVLREHLRQHEPDLPITAVVGDTIRLDSAEIPDDSFDIVYLKDLLEHVADYEAALRAAYRKLRPGGLIYIATTNVLCPMQQEYHGVGPYSWYPRWLKDRIRVYALEKRPEIVFHTDLPAVHWFTRRGLTRQLIALGFSRVWDVYDLTRTAKDLTRRTRLVYPLVRAGKAIPVLRDPVDILIPGLTLVAQR